MRHYGKLILCTAAMLAAMIAALRGQETAPDGRGVRAPGAVQSYKTVFFDLKLHECPAKRGNAVNRRFRKGLALVPNLSPVEQGWKGGIPCHSAECALKEGNAAGADRAVYGSVTMHRDIEKKRVGTSGFARYILKVDKRDTFRIAVRLVDLKSGAVLASFTEKAKEEDLDGTIDRMAASLRPYFLPREVPAAEEPVPEENTPVSHEEPAQEERPSAPDTEAVGAVRYHASLSFSFMVPAGSFRDVASFSLGNIAEGSVTGLFWERTDLRFSLGYYYLSSVRGEVTSYNSFYASLSAGYRFRIMESLDLVPLLGGGIQFHIVKNGGYSGGSGTYADPLVSLRCALEYGFDNGISLAATAGYVIFFENKNTGMYPVLDLGVKYAF